MYLSTTQTQQVHLFNNNQSTNQQRVGDWQCVICHNLNFAFRNQCNRCGLISKQQNEHQNTIIAYTCADYTEYSCGLGIGMEGKGLACFLTPLRKKNIGSPQRKIEENCEQLGGYDEENVDIKIDGNKKSMVSVSPVLRQLGL